MPPRSVCAWWIIIGCAAALPCGAAAQQRLGAAADVIFYADNTEFRNPFREGETIFGTAARAEARVGLGEGATLAAGVFANQRFGSESAFELVRPVLALSVRGRRSTFIIGTLDTPHVRRTGPDRTGPHGLIPPVQRETLAFDRPYEAGLQWTFGGVRLQHDLWLHWQRLNTPAHRERFDAGARVDWALRRSVTVPLQLHVVHEGGQLYASGPVRDSFVLASGVTLRTAPEEQTTVTPGRRPGVKAASLELLGLWSHYTPDRQQPHRTRDGAGFFGRAALESPRWRGHLVMWRGDDFVKDEGDANYHSIRRDGSRYRNVRDYAEAGLTRLFLLSPQARVAVSFRYHRIEHQYEYSYRVLGTVQVRTAPR